MARNGISYAQVAAAADSLTGTGQTATIKKIREALGSGSPNTVHRHLTTWRAAQPQTKAATFELPADLAASFAKELAKAAAMARAEIEQELIVMQDETEELSASGESLEAQITDLSEQIIEVTKSRDQALATAIAHAGEISRQAEEIERERKIAGEAQTEVARSRLKTEGQAEKIAEQRIELERINKLLDASRDERAKSEKDAAVLAAQLAAADARCAEIQKREATSSTERDAAIKTLADLRLSAQSVQSNLDSTQRELESTKRDLDESRKLKNDLIDVRKQLSEALASSKKAEIEAAELRGQVNRHHDPH